MNLYLDLRKRKKLTRLLKKLASISARPWQYSRKEYEKLTRKIKRLAVELKDTISPTELKRMIGPAALVLSLTLANTANAQNFKPPVQSPYGLNPSSVELTPNFVDIDGDGDLDLFSGAYGGMISYRENTGSPTMPQFGLPQQNPFGLTSSNYLSFTDFTDLDNDGDLDLLVGEYYGTLKYYENTGSATTPQFAAPLQNPFGLTSANYYAVPSFADLDNDGDTDLLVGEYYGVLKYYENTGTNSSPQFAGPQSNPFGLTSTIDYAFPDFTDLDNDGDLDLLIGEYTGDLKYYENTGSATTPQFASPQTNPFGLTSTYQISMPAFADIDNDGDQDLFVREDYGNIQYFENNSVPVDNDGDLFFSDVDCDDNDAAIFPGAVELCDGVDNNCDGVIDEGFNPTTYYADMDNDGVGSNQDTITNCTGAPAGYIATGGDCDDSDNTISPNAIEVCDGIDNNCDGNIDEGLPTFTYYPDADMDGEGNPIAPLTTCDSQPPPNWVANGDDCDDSNPNIYSTAPEICDGMDNNCDGNIDEGFPSFTYYIDSDMDGEGDPNISIVTCISQIPPGMVTNGDDCDDSNPNIYSTAPEICDGIDNNCDGTADEGIPVNNYYEDLDIDGYGSTTNFITSCDATAPTGYVVDNTDCDDNNDAINPGAMEIVNNGIDEDCDGMDLLSSNQDLNTAFGLSIYPNPASDRLHISGDVDQITVIEIYDIQGRRVYTNGGNALVSNAPIDVSSFGPGTYILKVTDRNQKIGIQRFNVLR